MITPISLSVSTLPVSTPTGLTDKYLRYLDTLSNLKENTAHLLEKTREIPSCSDLTQYELFSRQNEELQILFKKAMAQVREDCEKLSKLTSPTPPQSYYEKNFLEAIDNMHDALQEHTNALNVFKKTILLIKEKPESKTRSSDKPSTPVLVRQQTLFEITPPPSPTPPSISPPAPPSTPALHTRLWRKARNLFSFSKKKKWSPLPET